MKFVFLFAFLALAAVCSASPVDDGQLENFDEEYLKQIEGGEGDLVEIGDVLVRNKRATCPYFPGACSFHCKTKGFSTGFCRGGTCRCKNY